MTVTAITATYQRPEAMALCTRYLKRQTRQPDQWLVLDGPDPMAKKVLRAIEDGQIEGEVVAFVEDDDHFRADWLEWCEAGIRSGYEMVGEGNAVYYQIRHRWHSACLNVRHAALVQTAVHRDMLETIANVIRSYPSPWFDTRIWRLDAGKFLATPESPAERRVVGIKGMYASGAGKGYSGEHVGFHPPESRSDPAAIKLFEWLGEDAVHYLPFYEHPPRLD